MVFLFHCDNSVFYALTLACVCVCACVRVHVRARMCLCDHIRNELKIYVNYFDIAIVPYKFTPYHGRITFKAMELMVLNVKTAVYPSLGFIF